ncbi:ATP-binding protein [Streptomyces thermolineatus]|uniref:ATP-binding protein n=1 Tax=Streptomyces thermolineatus TaxID=44033 RepID=UPI00384AECFD
MDRESTHRSPEAAGPPPPPRQPPAPVPQQPPRPVLPPSAPPAPPAAAPPAFAVPDRPTTAPSPPAAPPPPAGAPGPENGFLAWLRAPRRFDAPGIYGLGHVPRPPEDPGRLPARQLLGGALLSLLSALLLWSLFWNGYLPVFPLVMWVTPDAWHSGTPSVVLSYAVYAAVVFLLVRVFGSLGRWREVLRRYVAPALRGLVEDEDTTDPAAAGPGADAAGGTAAWTRLRAVGRTAEADRLEAEAAAGRMNDVDHLRLERAWESAAGRPDGTAAFAEEVRLHGAAAFAHPSGARDLPARQAVHDLAARQVRIGAAPATDKNPHAHRGASVALDPALLGTSLLVVGPPGSGKTRHVVRPVVESMCLQALAGTAVVVAVGSPESDPGPAGSFDVVVAPGDPASAYDLDLYGGARGPDEAAALLAQALLPDDGTAGPGRRGHTVLAQLLGPFHAAHGRYPGVRELRELLDGAPAALAALRDALSAAGANPAHLRELEARQRHSERPGDAGPLLADRLAVLDRPAFADFFDASGRTRPFSLRALEHPLRVRVDLPERGHPEASRVLARLLLAQFTAAAAARSDRSLFACLVMDDAAHAVTAETLSGLQGLRSANAGTVLALRTLDDVPEGLRSGLVGAAGCRMVLPGTTTWDGRRFAEAWGTEWVEERDVTRTPDRTGGLLRRTGRGLRRLLTGEAATTESVTVRRVERERWSPSELAHGLPPGHAVLSLTTVRGEHVPPLLVDLRG